MDNLKKLQSIIEKVRVSAKDKQFIADLSIKYNLPFEPNAKCDSCYHDQAVLLALHLKKIDANEDVPRLREDIDVVINGVRINNATLTAELVEKYRGKGLPEHWFV